MNKGLIDYPAGEYYVGDPCYVIPNNDWIDFLDKQKIIIGDTSKDI